MWYGMMMWTWMSMMSLQEFSAAALDPMPTLFHFRSIVRIKSGRKPTSEARPSYYRRSERGQAIGGAVQAEVLPPNGPV